MQTLRVSHHKRAEAETLRFQSRRRQNHACIVARVSGGLLRPATSSPDGIRRCTGSAATLPASTTTSTVTNVDLSPYPAQGPMRATYQP
jgi:hypothetical protein